MSNSPRYWDKRAYSSIGALRNESGTVSDLGPAGIGLLEAQVPVGILVPDDETMRLVAVTPGVVAEHVAPRRSR
jgi:hypothetical protein